jgi:hypothetical protein
LGLEIPQPLGRFYCLFVRQIDPLVVVGCRHGVGLRIPDAPKLVILYPWDVSHSLSSSVFDNPISDTLPPSIRLRRQRGVEKVADRPHAVGDAEGHRRGATHAGPSQTTEALDAISALLGSAMRVERLITSLTSNQLNLRIRGRHPG